MHTAATVSAAVVAEFRKLYWRVSETAQRLTTPADRWDAARVYRELQSGRVGLEGICDGGRWLVSVASIEAYEAKRRNERASA